MQRGRRDFEVIVHTSDVEVVISALDNHRVHTDILTCARASIGTDNLQTRQVTGILAHIVGAVTGSSPSQFGVSLAVDLLLTSIDNHDNIALIDMQRTIDEDNRVVVLRTLVGQAAHGDSVITSIGTCRNLRQRTIRILDVVHSSTCESRSNRVVVLQTGNSVAEGRDSAAVGHVVTTGNREGDLHGLDGQGSNFQSLRLGGGGTDIHRCAGTGHDGDFVVAILVVQRRADGILADILTRLTGQAATQSAGGQFQGVLLQAIIGDVAGNLIVGERRVNITVILLVVLEGQGNGTSGDGDSRINHRQVVVSGLCVDGFQSIRANAGGCRSCSGGQGNALQNLCFFSFLLRSCVQQTGAALDVILHIHRSDSLTVGLLGLKQVDNGSALIDGEADVIGEADAIVLRHRLLKDVTAVNRISASVLACFTAQTSLREVSFGLCEAGGVVVKDNIGVIDCKAGVSLTVGLGQTIAGSDGQRHLMDNQHVLTIGLRQLNAVRGLVIQTEGQVVRTCIVQTGSVRSSLNGDTNNAQRNILAVHLDVDGFAIVVNLRAVGGVYVNGNFLGDGVGLLLTVGSLQGVEGDRDISLGDLERSLRSNRYDVVGVLIIGDGSLIVANNRGGVFPLGQVDVDVQRAALRVNHIDSLRTGLVIQRIAGGVLTGNAVLTDAVGSTLDGNRQCVDSQRAARTIAVGAGINDVVIGAGVTGNNDGIGADTGQLTNGIVNAILDGDSAAERSNCIMDADFVVACEVLVFQCAGNVSIAGILGTIQTLTVRNGDGQSALGDGVLVGSVEGDVVVLSNLCILELCITVSVRADSLADLTGHNAASKIGTNTATLAIDGVKSKGNAALGIAVTVDLRLTTHHIDGDGALGDSQLAVNEANEVVVVTVVVLAVSIRVPVRRPTLLRSTLNARGNIVLADIGSSGSATITGSINHREVQFSISQTDAILSIVPLETVDGLNLAVASSTIHSRQVAQRDSQHRGMNNVLAVDDFDIIVSSTCGRNLNRHRILANILVVGVLTAGGQNHRNQLVHTIISGDGVAGNDALFRRNCLSSTVVRNRIKGDGRRLALLRLTVDGINLVVCDGYITLGDFKCRGRKLDVITVDGCIRLDVANRDSVATGSGSDAGQNHGRLTAQAEHLFQSNSVRLVLVVGLVLEVGLISIGPAGDNEVNCGVHLTILTSGLCASRGNTVIALEDEDRSQRQSAFRNYNVNITGVRLNIDIVVGIALSRGTKDDFVRTCGVLIKVFRGQNISREQVAVNQTTVGIHNGVVNLADGIALRHISGMRDNVNLALVDGHACIVADVLGRIQVGTVDDGVVQTVHRNAHSTGVHIGRISTGIAVDIRGVLAVAIGRSIHDKAQTVDSCLNILLDFLRGTGIRSAVLDRQTVGLERVTIGVSDGLGQDTDDIVLTTYLGVLDAGACSNLLTGLGSSDCLKVANNRSSTAAIKRADTAVVDGVFLAVTNLHIQVRHVKVCTHNGVSNLLILAQRIIHILDGFPVVYSVQLFRAACNHCIKNRVLLVSLPCLAGETKIVCSGQDFIFAAYKGVSRINKRLCCFADSAARCSGAVRIFICTGSCRLINDSRV